MSSFSVTVEEITGIKAHPNADRLEIAQVLGTQTIVPKGEYKPGDRVVFFPPDMLISPEAADQLGVSKYLKHSDYDGRKCRCRVAATRLRGVPSYGFISPANGEPVGADVSDRYGARKYEPPVKYWGADGAPDHPAFHTYTTIEHYWRFPDVLKEGEQVVATEKCHGTNSRVGLIRLEDEWEFMAGTHRRRLKQPEKPNVYWEPLGDERVLNLLTNLCAEEHNVILFGEIYGPGIQDMDYGESKPTFRAFDISIDGEYVNFDVFRFLCIRYDIPTVPVLYQGPFSPEIITEYTNGPTTIGEPKCKFKGREGIVIKPFKERVDWNVGRVILKSVSADYLGRKGGTDN